MNSKILSVALPVFLSMAISGGMTLAFALGHDYQPTFVKDKRNRHDGYQRHESRRHRYYYEHHDYRYARPYGYSYYPRSGFKPYYYYYQPDSYFLYRGDRRGRRRGC